MSGQGAYKPTRLARDILLALWMILILSTADVDGWKNLRKKGFNKKILYNVGVKVGGGIANQAIGIAGKGSRKLFTTYAVNFANPTLALMTDDELERTRLYAPDIIRNISFILPKIGDDQWTQANELSNIPGSAYVIQGAGVMRYSFPFNDTGDTNVRTDDGQVIVMDSWNVTRFFAIIDDACTLTSLAAVNGETTYNNSGFDEDDYGRPSAISAGESTIEYACASETKKIEISFDSPLSICEMAPSGNAFASFVIDQEWYKQYVSEFGDSLKIYSLSYGGDPYLLGCKGSQSVEPAEQCDNAMTEVLSAGSMEKINCSIFISPENTSVDTENIPSYPTPADVMRYEAHESIINIQDNTLATHPFFTSPTQISDYCDSDAYINDELVHTKNTIIHEALRRLFVNHAYIAGFMDPDSKVCFKVTAAEEGGNRLQPTDGYIFAEDF